MGFYTLLRCAKKNAPKSLLIISLLILLLDIVFVGLNYSSSKNALIQNLSKRARNHQNEFGIMLEMTYTNMMQMAQFISNDQDLNQLFLQGKKAVEAQRDSGDIRAQEIRHALLKQVKPAWDKLTADFNVRQLHYHLGPGSLSFLRVHTPEKYGDRMDEIRHTIVDTNAEKKARTGFETGRIYCGLRAVTPIWTEDPESGRETFVGSLEVGTSFDLILPMFEDFYSVNTAVLLTREHIENRMWPEFVEKYSGDNPDIEYYLESVSSADTRRDLIRVLKQLGISSEFVARNAGILELDDRYLSAYYFPLRDYEGEKNPALPPAGFVLMWENVTPMVDDLYASVKYNIIYAIVGFILVEIILIWTFKRELRLVVAERDATRDPLTGLYNRRYFDRTLHCELTTARHTGRGISLLVCDIDQFKAYNDKYGHQQGDMCLQQVAACLKQNLSRNIDWIARYGGEEFVVVLPDTDLNGAVHVAERLIKAVKNLGIIHEYSSVNKVVTLSIGAASSVSADNARKLFELADQNLYRAKQQGRNRVVAIQGDKSC
ncbi:MAG: diguanylate cyclase [Desulfuromonadaceae bacterium]